MSTSPVSPNSPSSSSSNPSSSAASSTASEQSAIDALGNPDTFLQLLVAQLQYQDPESPADGTTFVTQLATFAGVEEQSAMRTDLDSIDQVAQQYSASQTAASAAAAAATSPATDSSSGGTSAGTGGTTSPSS